MKKTGKKKFSLAKKQKDFALNKDKHSKVRREFIDYDYVDQLSSKDKEWLARFSREWVDASFPKDGTRLHPVVEGEVSHGHTSKEVKDYYKKDVENRNNARNRCLYGKENSLGRTMGNIHDFKFEDLAEGLSSKENPQQTEDDLIAILDWYSESDKSEQ